MQLALFQPDIAQNLGAAMRLCACFGVPLAVIEPCGFPLTSKDVRRAALDYGDIGGLIRHKSWHNFQNCESQTGRRIVLLSTKASTNILDFTFTNQDTLLFGRESAGVPEAVAAQTDAQIHIPLNPNARSLNLVSSASIALFEALRQLG